MRQTGSSVLHPPNHGSPVLPIDNLRALELACFTGVLTCKLCDCRAQWSQDECGSRRGAPTRNTAVGVTAHRRTWRSAHWTLRVFERVFGYRAAPGVKVPRFTEDHEMTEAVIDHIQEAWQPREFRVWRRMDAGSDWAVEAMIRTGPQSAYGGSGPTRGVAVCRAALFLVANRARKRG